MKHLLIAISSVLMLAACGSKTEQTTTDVATVAHESMPENSETNLPSLVENPAPPAGETFEKINFRLGGKVDIPNSSDWRVKDISALLEERKKDAQEQGLTNGNLQEWYNEKMDATLMVQDVSLSDDYTNEEGLKMVTDHLLAANRRDAEKFEDMGHKNGKIGSHIGVKLDGKFDNGKKYVTRDYALGSTTACSVSIEGRAPEANAKYIQQLIDYIAYNAGK